MVLLVEPKAKRGEWPLGRITETHPGADGQVRVAKVAVGKYEYLRPVNRLCMPARVRKERTLNIELWDKYYVFGRGGNVHE